MATAVTEETIERAFHVVDDAWSRQDHALRDLREAARSGDSLMVEHFEDRVRRCTDAIEVAWDVINRRHMEGG